MSRANLLILPGLLENGDGFREVIRGLQGSIDCTVADMTGADAIAGLAANALRQAPEGELMLAGHSMGGYVALEIMRSAPQRISRLALLNTHARPDSPESSDLRRRLMALADRDFGAVVDALIPKLLLPTHLDDAALLGIVKSMARAIGPEAFKRQEAAIIGRIDSRPHLKAIRVPTVVIASRGDAIMPVEILQELSDGIAGARLAIVENSGHMAAIEQPVAVLEVMRKWAAA
jgi:pimeloyl-ACP methyl ester carboxylesterase